MMPPLSLYWLSLLSISIAIATPTKDNMYHLRYMRRSLSSSTAFAQRRSCIHGGYRMSSTLKQKQSATFYRPRTLSVLMPSNYRKLLYTSSSLVQASLTSLETDIDSNDNILSSNSIIISSSDNKMII